ncbi:hypothetical protein [Serpentinimonas maccroryi]|uniref:hypothetical protein n=1 Tax=Serpentinimonas maccroryi TaxID=1458426 RepID=UPI002033F952|nr:hypothetical protein [Serpentinimonas maccroryi]MCM2480210.1 hypothetical protein [Serpentinimonas maccroryi]
MWWNLFIFVVSSFLSAALAPRPPAPKPAALADIDAPTAEEGRPIPVVFGAVLIRGPNVVWYGDLVADPIHSSSGGKK